MHLVGLYTYCRMMHGAYNVKFIFNFIFLQDISENGVNVDLEYIEMFPCSEVKTVDKAVNLK